MDWDDIDTQHVVITDTEGYAYEVSSVCVINGKLHIEVAV